MHIIEYLSRNKFSAIKIKQRVLNDTVHLSVNALIITNLEAYLMLIDLL